MRNCRRGQRRHSSIAVKGLTKQYLRGSIEISVIFGGFKNVYAVSLIYQKSDGSRFSASEVQAILNENARRDKHWVEVDPWEKGYSKMSELERDFV